MKGRNIFQTVSRYRPKRNFFNLSYPTKGSLKTGVIYPIYAEEVCPGDIANINTGIVLRSQPMLAPLFTNYYADIRYFYVPNRIIWSDWKDFMMQVDENGMPLNTGIIHPDINPLDENDEFKVAGYSDPGTLYDWLGVTKDNSETFNSLPFRAYNMIWNEYFRDQNLQNPLVVESNEVTSFSLMRACWFKDYFTSALPWTQRGSAVELPAEVILRSYDGKTQRIMTPRQNAQGDTVWSPYTYEGYDPTVVSQYLNVGDLRGYESDQVGTSSIPRAVFSGGVLGYHDGTSNRAAAIDPHGTLGVNVNIRDLRKAAAVQRFLEREALVGGGRYADWIRGIFGVDIGDKTLDRPQYLGGGRQAINVSPVEQNSATSSVSPQGTLVGKGYLAGAFRTNKTYAFAEHGWLMGVLVIRPEALYYRGLNRHLTKESRYSYVIPGFEGLGEQEISNREVYNISIADELDAPTLNAGSFGYQKRWSEYQHHPGEIHGDMKASMNQYVLARGFTDNLTTPIPLNSSFVECNPDESNVFAVSSEVADPWLLDGYNAAGFYRIMKHHPKPLI